jgi:hypothetical protein
MSTVDAQVGRTKDEPEKDQKSQAAQWLALRNCRITATSVCHRELVILEGRKRDCEAVCFKVEGLD